MRKLLPATQVLEAARLAIYHTEKDKNIQQQMAAYGFTIRHRKHGKNLLARVLLTQAVHMSHADEWGRSAPQLRADLQGAQTTFKAHVQAVRKAFRQDAEVLHSLQIQPIARKRSEWLQQALHFYNRLETLATLPETLDMDKTVIAQAKASIQALLEIKEEQFKKSGQPKVPTRNKTPAAETKVFNTLDAWVTEFHRIASIAFKDNPKMLEVFGMKVSQAHDFQLTQPGPDTSIIKS